MKTATALGLIGSFGLLASAGVALHRRQRPASLSEARVVPLVVNYIDSDVSAEFLARLARVPEAEPVTIVIHTQGGLVGPCVQIANTLANRRGSVSAVVPLAALSGGTLIALSAERVSMCSCAALSAVDPVFGCQRSQHSEDFDSPGMQKVAREYLAAMTRVLDSILERRNAASARSLLLGERQPHGWPLSIVDLERAGLIIDTADPRWIDYLNLQGLNRCE